MRGLCMAMNSFLVILICVFCFMFFVFLISFLVLELLMWGKESDKYVQEREIKDLVKKFHKKLDTVSKQKTNEILECLKEMEELDNIYYVMADSDYCFMDEDNYFKLKCNILSDIIKNKIDNIKDNRKEKYKSMIDELNVCQKRYPLYKNIYFSFMSSLKSKI